MRLQGALLAQLLVGCFAAAGAFTADELGGMRLTPHWYREQVVPPPYPGAAAPPKRHCAAAQIRNHIPIPTSITHTKIPLQTPLTTKA